MATSTPENFVFGSVTTEHIAAFKRLFEIVWHDSPEKQAENLQMLDNVLSDEECVGNSNDLDDLMSYSEFDIARYSFDWRELGYGFLGPISHFSKQHGLNLDIDNIPNTDDVYETLSYINDQLNEIGFTLIFWNQGLDIYTLSLVRNQDTDEALEIAELLGFEFLIPDA